VILTLAGDTFAITQNEHNLVQQFVAQFGVHGVERVDGEGYDPMQLPQLLQGASLFAARRLVVLKNAAANKSLWEALADWAEKVPDETTLVVVEPQPDKRTRTYKMLKSKTDFKEFVQPSDNELAAWAQEQAKKLGATLSAPDARYLTERTGRDQWRMNHELDKLASYQPEITRQTIDNLVEPSPEGTAFELLDAALAGNTARVTSLIRNLKTEEDPYKLFGLLASQVHTLAVVAVAGTRSPDQIAKDAGLHPFVVRKSQAVARQLGPAKIRQVAADVALCDYQLKSTGADPWQLIATCLQRMAAE
jgi:DNA polymerase-3 subunit delta